MPETMILDNALKIIKNKIDNNGFVLSEIIDEVGEILVRKENPDGLIIEDEETISSLIIYKSETIIVEYGKDIQVVPSDILFDALYIWNQIKNI
jgi:hypothetical protein